MSTEWLLLGLRLGAILIIYLFVLQVGLILWRDLRSEGRTGKTESVTGCLRVLEKGQTEFSLGAIIQLASVNSIGRSEENAICLKDDFTSTKHALLSYRRKKWWLRDLGSTNGTFANQRQVKGEVPLAYGDIIGIGSVKFRLEKS